MNKFSEGGDKMTDIELLRKKIKESGYKISFIAQRCGITYQAFLNRMNGEIEFRADEMRHLRELLGLSMEESDLIFFASRDDETSTKEVI